MTERIAIPLANGALSPHFGSCDSFALFTVKENAVIAEETASAPVHEHGSFPSFLKSLGCTLVISGGMGIKAINMFTQSGIKVVIGVEIKPPKELVEQYIRNELVTGTNLCDH